MTNRLFNFTGYALTPPALFINFTAWLENLNMNGLFTFVISTCVVIFWYFKIKEQRFKAKQAEKELAG